MTVAHRQPEEKLPLLLHRFPKPVLGAFGYLLGIVILFTDNSQSGASSFDRLMEKPPEVILWCMILAAQVGMWCIIVPVLIPVLHTYRLLICREWMRFGGIVIAIAAIFSTFLLSRFVPKGLILPIDHQMAKILFLTVMGFIPFVMALTGIFLVGESADQEINVSTEFSRETRRLIDLREHLAICLSSAGLIISAATVATGVLQKAVHALNATYTSNSLYALLYGSFGTGVILLFYLPAYLSLRSATAQVTQLFLPLPNDANAIGAWRDQQQKYEGILGFDKTVIEGLKAGIAILAPIIAGAVSYIALKP